LQRPFRERLRISPQDTVHVRFTIRDVLWLTVVVALAVGWGLDRWRTTVELKLLNSEIAKLNGRITQLRAGPDWAGNDRLMENYEARWDFIRRRERELGLKPSDAPDYADPRYVSPDDSN
jgi:hypothetical protein